MSTAKHHLAVAVAAALVLVAPGESRAQSHRPAASFTSDGKLAFPRDYRTWVYLSSGMGMAYTEGGGGENGAFDNVFVDPGAYAAFQKSGTWPEGTVLVLEVRGAEAHASINKGGRSQATVMGLEAHVKDSARFKSGWAFFPMNAATQAVGAAAAQNSSCNMCHEQHAAVDTTFVQFYPTLLPVSTAKGTLSAAYLEEEKTKAATK